MLGRRRFSTPLIVKVMLMATLLGMVLLAQGTTLPTADRVLIKKKERKLYLFRDNQPFRTYDIALGWNPFGPKQREGDGRTPEGRYIIDWRNPDSRFFLALHVSYPNGADLSRARAKGVSPGGMIMIHGVSQRRLSSAYPDWTEGCIAVSNQAIQQIWAYVKDGTPVEIVP